MEYSQTEQALQEKLWQAAANGDCKTIRILAMSEVDIDARNEEGFTAFNLATQSGHADAAMAILAAREMRFARDLGVDPAEFYKAEKPKAEQKKSA